LNLYLYSLIKFGSGGAAQSVNHRVSKRKVGSTPDAVARRCLLGTLNAHLPS